MTIDHDKLSELAKTLTEDQRRLLREGLGADKDVDAATLSRSLRSLDTKAVFAKLADAPDAGAGNAGTTDAGTVAPDAGTSAPHREPPLTRW